MLEASVCLSYHHNVHFGTEWKKIQASLNEGNGEIHHKGSKKEGYVILSYVLKILFAITKDWTQECSHSAPKIPHTKSKT